MFNLLKIPIESAKKTKILQQLEEKIQNKEKTHICTINPEILVESQNNTAFQKVLKTTWNITDGFGIQFWAKTLYKQNLARISGVNLAEEVIKMAEKHQKKVALVGGFAVAEKSAGIMQKKYPNLQIVYAKDGHPNQIDQDLQSSGAEVLLVAFGAPAQEFFIQEAFKTMPDLQMGIGIGGTFDFWTKKIKRAPKWMQNLGLEWLFRLILEPKKRCKRIFTAVFIFSWKTIVDFIDKRSEKNKKQVP